ncbi:3-oxoacyl-[acyl-carrier protein] reductase [Ruminococcus flavefaciens]|uniref:3-oxoacyl-[acyl-carrier protein] reductase n=1 Tax=Ruminococcus flavefaciens TaxID=1265 RepID=A0A1H6IJ99_RUMFL|nr:SDR family oxidoreductase [Ruminococcus flavefaciens]SEH46606.1 3-oxoacyl-[acyl-carrier protein] reductase [Ruminococcus flavefaciens]
MGLGIKSFLRSIIMYTKEEKKVPILRNPIAGHEFEGKVALIAGGSGGIGLAISKILHKSGCKVIIAGTSKTKLEEIIKTFNSKNVSALVLDYAHPESFESKVNEAVEIFNKIDIFVSSTGIHVDRDGLDFLNSTIEEYDSIMGINLRGTYFMCQQIAKYMIESNIHGHICLVSSQSALEPSWSPYRLSKLGISGITKGLAQRLLEHNIIVNAVGPGPTATGMQKNYDGSNLYTNLCPNNRYTMPEEVAEVVKLLVSDIGDTIIGDTVYMSGGRGVIDLR